MSHQLRPPACLPNAKNLRVGAAGYRAGRSILRHEVGQRTGPARRGRNEGELHAVAVAPRAPGAADDRRRAVDVQAPRPADDGTDRDAVEARHRGSSANTASCPPDVAATRPSERDPTRRPTGAPSTDGLSRTTARSAASFPSSKRTLAAEVDRRPRPSVINAAGDRDPRRRWTPRRRTDPRAYASDVSRRPRQSHPGHQCAPPTLPDDRGQRRDHPGMDRSTLR